MKIFVCIFLPSAMNFLFFGSFILSKRAERTVFDESKIVRKKNHFSPQMSEQINGHRKKNLFSPQMSEQINGHRNV